MPTDRFEDEVTAVDAQAELRALVERLELEAEREDAAPSRPLDV
jgi:hypothetical protein